MVKSRRRRHPDDAAIRWIPHPINLHRVEVREPDESFGYSRRWRVVGYWSNEQEAKAVRDSWLHGKGELKQQGKEAKNGNTPNG